MTELKSKEKVDGGFTPGEKTVNDGSTFLGRWARRDTSTLTTVERYFQPQETFRHFIVNLPGGER
jgi:hypothetical protein